MYKTQTENCIIANNITISVLKECTVSSGHYALLRISIFGAGTYALCVLGEDYAMEIVGESHADAERIYELAVREGVSPVHLFDVVGDIRREANEEKI